MTTAVITDQKIVYGVLFSIYKKILFDLIFSAEKAYPTSVDQQGNMVIDRLCPMILERFPSLSRESLEKAIREVMERTKECYKLENSYAAEFDLTLLG